MAKDGTNRGGARVGAGRKKKPLAEKLQEGKAAKAIVLQEPPELTPADLPDVKEYLSDDQRTGTLYGKEIYLEVWEWLSERGCAQLVSPQLLEQYSMAMARYVQLEKITSEYGFISKHPTTGGMIGSPFVSMAQGYLKQANLLWQQIYGIVESNCTEPVTGNPQDAMMEQLLSL